MSQLANLLAMQKKARESGNENGKNSQPVRDAASPAREAQPGADADGAGQVSRESAVASEAGAQVAAKPAALTGLNLLKRGQSVGGGIRPTTPAGTVNQSRGADDGNADSGQTLGTEFGLADLARLDVSDTPVVESRDNQTRSWFEDEIEATAPDRALDSDLTPQQLSFVEVLDSIYSVVNDPEMFGQSVRMVMHELQENPEYEKLIADQDIHTMIRGMRNTMGLARIRKQEKSRKAGGKKAQGKAAQDLDKNMALLDSLMGGGSLD